MPLRLPSATSQRRLERGVRAHAGDLRCSADSPAFKAYVLRSLEKFVAEARRQELEGQYPQPHRLFRYPESVSNERMNLPQRSEVEVRGAKHASTAQHQFAYSVTFCVL